MSGKNCIPNLNPDPLLTFDQSAVYIGYKTGRVLSVALSRGRHPFLKQNVIYVGGRPKFRQSALETFIESRKASSLMAAQ